WTAATRARADFIVTENLEDGPSVDIAGIRRFRNIIFIAPDQFLSVVDAYADWVTSLGMSTVEEASASALPTQEFQHTSVELIAEPMTELSPSVRDFLEQLLSRTEPTP